MPLSFRELVLLKSSCNTPRTQHFDGISTSPLLERELGRPNSRVRSNRGRLRRPRCRWAESEGFGTDEEVEWLSALVYERRRELYEAIDRLIGDGALVVRLL